MKAVLLKILIFGFIRMGILQSTASTRPCTTSGSFEIDDGTCQNYYMCVSDGVGYVSFDIKCAASMVFNPSLGKCVASSSYTCTQTATTVSATSSATPSATASGTASATASETASATASETASATASETVSATASGTASVTASTTPTTIPTTIPTTVSTTPSTTTPTTASTTPSTTTVAPCEVTGRFEIPDPKCQKYYYCYVNGATVIRYDLQCPNSLRFNPKSQKCVLPQNYSCPTAA